MSRAGWLPDPHLRGLPERPGDCGVRTLDRGILGFGADRSHPDSGSRRYCGDPRRPLDAVGRRAGRAVSQATCGAFDWAGGRPVASGCHAAADDPLGVGGSAWHGEAARPVACRCSRLLGLRHRSAVGFFPRLRPFAAGGGAGDRVLPRHARKRAAASRRDRGCGRRDDRRVPRLRGQGFAGHARGPGLPHDLVLAADRPPGRSPTSTCDTATTPTTEPEHEPANWACRHLGIRRRPAPSACGRASPRPGASVRRSARTRIRRRGRRTRHRQHWRGPRRDRSSPR